ncbi:MAG: hypothetical protein HYX24_02640 [Candidatus Aenigmarchaeota archaeon]|nr:hypothetical protein [Candidatus Aenigmarchaeota archaeon]
MKQFLVQCTHCKRLKTIIISRPEIYGTKTKCYYCNKGFTVNRESLVRQVDYGERVKEKDYKDAGFSI